MAHELVPFYFVRRGDNLWNISKRVFSLSTNTAVANKVNQIVASNPHIKNPDRIHPGQILYIGAGLQPQMPITANDMCVMEECFNSGPNYQNDLVADNFDTLQTLHDISNDPNDLSFLNDTTVSPTSIAAVSNGAVIATTTTFMKGTKEVVGAAKKVLKVGIKAGNAEFGNLLRISPHEWDVVQGKLVRGLNNRINYVRQSSGALRMIPNALRSFDQQGKVILVNPSGPSFQRFSSTVRTVKDWMPSAESAQKWAGRAGLVLTFGIAGSKVYEDRNSPNLNRTITRETVSVGAGLAFGVAASSTAHAACLVLDFTTGVGGVACHLGVLIAYGAAASYAASNLGETAATVVFGSEQPSTVGK